MGYRLYGARRSGSCIVECALALAGAPVEIEDISIHQNGQRSDTYAAMNPSRKIPTLVGPGGETLTETAAIAITLAERFPNGGLLPPRGTSDRDQALRWLVFVATELYPIVEINDYPERFAVDPASTDAVRELARAHWRHRWIIVEEAVTGSPWLLASGFCMADVYLGVVSRWAQQDVWRSDHLPKIEAIAAGLADHPIVGPVWRRHFDRDG